MGAIASVAIKSIVSAVIGTFAADLTKTGIDKTKEIIRDRKGEKAEA